MMKPPCERVTMQILPAVRASLAQVLVERHGMTRAGVARRLGVTQAAVTQYFKETRGTRNKAAIDGAFRGLIEELAGRIARDERDLGSICELCRTIREDPRFGSPSEGDGCDVCG
jgi:predicted transcriptional regulator